MGLDMYAFVAPSKDVGDAQIMEGFTADVKPLKVAYWRKFNHLHGWMRRLYEKKGGTGEFNCVYLRLDAQDIVNMANDLRSNKLTHEAGFCFGSAELDQYDIDNTERFIELAADALVADYAVYYYSWW